MNRREFMIGAAALATTSARAAGPVTELRIGFQKTAVLLVVKAQKLLEQHFASKGIWRVM